MKTFSDLVAPALLALAVTACSTKEPAAPVCCAQPETPAGTPRVVVVADQVTGPSDAQRVVLRAGLAAQVKRDEVYPALHSLYRHVMKRGAFEPIELRAELYESEAAARAGGDAGRVASIVKGQRDLGPRCENGVKYDFAEQAQRAFAAGTGLAEPANPDDSCRLTGPPRPRVDQGFARKPTMKIDEARRAVEITFPHTEMGAETWSPALGFNAALRDWIDQVSSLFRRVEDLSEITYHGVHQDQTVVKITVTRAQFEEGLASLQDEIASHATLTVATLGSGAASDREAHREQETFKTKTYKAALASLPKSQVFVWPKLK